MARQFVRSSSQHFSIPSVVVSTTPMSFFCWVLFDSLGTRLPLVSIFNSAGGAGWILRKDQNDKFNARTSMTASNDALSAQTAITNRWYPVCATFKNSNNRRIYVFGTLDTAVDGTGRTPSGHNTTYLGTTRDSLEYHNGRIAEPAIWNVSLTPDEVNRLSAGQLPSTIRSGNLKGYWPLVRPGNVAFDKSGNGNHMTDSGGPIGMIKHPPLRGKDSGVVAIPPYRPQAVILDDWNFI